MAAALGGGTIVGGIVDLVIGLLGLRGAKNPRKVGPFFVLCIIGLVLGLVGLGMSLAQGTFDLWSLVSVVIVAVCLYPVSYTHLDVYKRQIYKRVTSCFIRVL